MNKEFIIEKIKSNKRYLNNEDLLECFVNSVFAYIDEDVINSLDENLRNKYLDKIIAKSIIKVLKQNSRYKISNSSSLTRIDYSLFNYDNKRYFLKTTPSIDKLKQLYQFINKLEENNKSKFLDVIMYKYQEKQKLNELVDSTNLSKNELVDILFELSDYANRIVKI